MSQYQQSPGQLKYLKGMYAKLAKDKADQEQWNTPYDEEMSLADAQKAVRAERRRFELGRRQQQTEVDSDQNQE
jgi:hypothetical protein